MKETILEYRGYCGSVQVSLADSCIHGKILHITDLVTYEAKDVSGVEAEFRAAVDDYLETCKEVGKEPERPFKGSFNVRMAPRLHRNAALAATKAGITLNEFITRAVESALEKPTQQVVEIHDHHHDHHYHSYSSSSFSGPGEATWKPTQLSTPKLH